LGAFSTIFVILSNEGPSSVSIYNAQTDFIGVINTPPEISYSYISSPGTF